MAEQVRGQRPRGKYKNTMTGHPCTQHGPENRRNGRCQVCRHAARKRYQRSRAEAYRKLQAIEGCPRRSPLTPPERP